jgi:hypothetical protein
MVTLAAERNLRHRHVETILNHYTEVTADDLYVI